MPPEQDVRGPAKVGRPAHDALVLAGGRARRLDGASKPDVLLGGRRLIDRVLDAAVGARRVAVVGPAEVAPPGVLVTLEDPPSGGPVAGIAAGLAALSPGADLVLLLACDVPHAAPSVDALFAALAAGVPPMDAVGSPGEVEVRDASGGSAEGGSAGGPAELDGAALDGAALVDDDGRLQPLVGLYRRASLDAALATLSAAGGVRNAPVHRLLDLLRLVRVPDPRGDGLDIDTWDDLASAERRTIDD